MTDSPNKIIPNSFQTPNFFVDECMAYLTGNEIKCVIFLARKTFGWQKRSDRISKPQLIEATGLNGETLDGCMNYLMTIGLVLRLHENNARNEGIEWALQLEDEKIRFDLLKERKAKQEETQQRRTQKARDTIAQMRGDCPTTIPPKSLLSDRKRMEGGLSDRVGGILSDRVGVGLSDSIHKSQLKPKKRTWSQMHSQIFRAPIRKTQPESDFSDFGKAGRGRNTWALTRPRAFFPPTLKNELPTSPKIARRGRA